MNGENIGKCKTNFRTEYQKKTNNFIEKWEGIIYLYIYILIVKQIKQIYCNKTPIKSLKIVILEFYMIDSVFWFLPSDRESRCFFFDLDLRSFTFISSVSFNLNLRNLSKLNPPSTKSLQLLTSSARILGFSADLDLDLDLDLNEKNKKPRPHKF